jgi:hypothetical protein
MTTIDFKALGFVLDAAGAAEVLGKTVTEVRDLVLVGELHALIGAASPMAPLAFWFHPDEVARVEVTLRELSNRTTLATDRRNRLRVLKALRAYLASVPVTDDYDDAIQNNAPLLGRTRNDGLVIHVRVEAVASFGSVADGMPVTQSMTKAALEYVGALRVRGITPANTSHEQRWGVWWRLPDGFGPGQDSDDPTARGMVEGAREPGERVTRRGGGAAYLVDPLVPAADGLADD